MKNLVRLFLLILPVLQVGCAGSRAYFIDRGRDAADILTVTVGKGVGAKARAGPLNTSFFVSGGDLVGLRNGSWCDSAARASKDTKSAEFFVVGSERVSLGRERGKSFFAINTFFFEVPEDVQTYPVEFFTQVEVAVGVGLFLRLGVNPGEILDFLLGWAMLDIFRDDVASDAGKEPAGAKQKQ